MAERAAHRSQELGRLFWVWLLTLPIILMLAATFAFGAPWPDPLLLRLAMVALAFPVVFIVGEPVFHDALAARRRGKWGLSVTVAAAATLGYASGLLALVAPLPSLAGPAAILVCLYLTGKYLAGRDPGAAAPPTTS